MFLIDDLALSIPLMVSALATAGSTAASMAGRNAVLRQQKKAQVAEAMRQNEIDTQRIAALNAAAPKFTPEATKQQREDITSQLTSYLTPTPSAATDYTPSEEAPQEVKDSMARALTGAIQKGKSYAKNAANVAATGRVNMAQNQALGQLGQRVAQLNSQGTRSANILPMELQDANLKGLPAQYAAAGLQGIGNIANMYAGYNMLSNAIPKTPTGLPTTGSAIWPGAYPGNNMGAAGFPLLYPQ